MKKRKREKMQQATSLEFLGRRLKGASLISTIILSLVLVSIAVVFLVLGYYNMLLDKGEDIDRKLENNLLSAIALSLAGKMEDSSLLVKDSLLLFHSPDDSVYMENERWGCFDVIKVRARYKKREVSRIFFTGAAGHQYDDASLYLADNNRPLLLSGNTFISGKVYLPKQGVKPTFINQVGFNGNRLINGIIDTSKSILPSLNSRFVSYVQSLSDGYNDSSSALPTEITRSFDLPATRIKGGDSLQLIDNVLKGKIIVYANASIIIDRNAVLENIILVAPYIEFREGFRGVVQAFAYDSINVNSGCTLNYPSALVLVSNKKGSHQGSLNLKGNSYINGVICSSGFNTPNNFVLINFHQGSMAEGLVYCQGYLNLAGELRGNAFTANFLYKDNAVAMDNLVSNGIIVKSRYTGYMSLFSLLTKATKNKIIQWVE